MPAGFYYRAKPRSAYMLPASNCHQDLDHVTHTTPEALPPDRLCASNNDSSSVLEDLVDAYLVPQLIVQD
jgi:hypothetical protein